MIRGTKSLVKKLTLFKRTGLPTVFLRFDVCYPFWDQTLRGQFANCSINMIYKCLYSKYSPNWIYLFIYFCKKKHFGRCQGVAYCTNSSYSPTHIFSPSNSFQIMSFPPAFFHWFLSFFLILSPHSSIRLSNNYFNLSHQYFLFYPLQQFHRSFPISRFENLFSLSYLQDHIDIHLQ